MPRFRNGEKTKFAKSNLSNERFPFSKVLDFLVFLISISATITAVQNIAKNYYWAPWIFMVLLYFSFRIAKHFQYLEFRVGPSYAKDLALLDHLLYGFKVDSLFYQNLKGLVREDKISNSLLRYLEDLADQFQQDPVKLRNRKLQERSSGFSNALLF